MIDRIILFGFHVLLLLGITAFTLAAIVEHKPIYAIVAGCCLMASVCLSLMGDGQ